MQEGKTFGSVRISAWQFHLLTNSRYTDMPDMVQLASLYPGLTLIEIA
jgi:hypothetical protein